MSENATANYIDFGRIITSIEALKSDIVKNINFNKMSIIGLNYAESELIQLMIKNNNWYLKDLDKEIYENIIVRVKMIAKKENLELYKY